MGIIQAAITMLSEDDKQMIARALKWRTALTDREVIGRLRDVANETNIGEVVPLIPEELARLLTDGIAKQRTLRGAGYWYSSLADNERFPDPSLLTCLNWRPTQKSAIVRYLREGKTYAQWRGFSACRFRCGIPSTEMGSKCLTDGEWVWPEGLAHYIEAHAVRLPDEFVEAMRRNSWQVPFTSAHRDEHGLPDMSFWITWGTQTRKSAL